MVQLITLVTNVVAQDHEMKRKQDMAPTIPILSIDVSFFLELNKDCDNVEEQVKQTVEGR